MKRLNETVCVEIIVLNDDRIHNTIHSLLNQKRKPDRILVADGGSGPEFLNCIRNKFTDHLLEIWVLPGLPVETRRKSLELLQEDITVFLDSDQVAPEGWLENLISPFLEKDSKLSFTGGPTKPYKEATTEMEKYINLVEEQIYESDLKKKLTYIPLGNTAWKTSVLKELGFDSRLKFEAEDNDLETRAYQAGYYGVFVKDAWVWHDKSSETSFLRGMKKRYKYLVGAATVFIKNGTLISRYNENRSFVPHPFAMVETILKPVALIHAYVRWHLIIKNQPH